MPLGRSRFISEIAAADINILYRDLAIAYYNLCHIIDSRYNALRRGFVGQIIGLIFIILLVEYVFVAMGRW